MIVYVLSYHIIYGYGADLTPLITMCATACRSELLEMIRCYSDVFFTLSARKEPQCKPLAPVDCISRKTGRVAIEDYFLRLKIYGSIL